MPVCQVNHGKATRADEELPLCVSILRDLKFSYGVLYIMGFKDSFCPSQW